MFLLGDLLDGQERVTGPDAARETGWLAGRVAAERSEQKGKNARPKKGGGDVVGPGAAGQQSAVVAVAAAAAVVRR